MTTLPQHVAIVMDGNGRWAKRRGLPRAAGHRAGASAVKKAVKFAVKNRIEVLTLFALSVENKKLRPISEVNYLMSLFLDSLIKNIDELHKHNIKVCVIGERSELDEKLIKQVELAEALTQQNEGMIFNIAINYSGRWDIVQAMKKIAVKVLGQQMDVGNIDEHLVQQYLNFHALPEPDLFIRTSGEQRISNFMLWQFAYTEMFFTPTLWPDFNEDVFQQALTFFATRNRRFGKTNEQIEIHNA